ncbi:mas-related G-protein coupled receptor member D-like [Melozone crissalis]|uniref:mas-related G-protein coupled receptor member D-like n=1 Tax=Melozone crissalis TaxID=40204 RepID=UPI0023DACA0E|nr:mas-related G-protein coupled receptor member D-like [Melozone crissalis]
MEVTTVSPSPASPTEGDDLCETDVTSLAIHSVTLLICLCGLAGNRALLWVLGSHCSSSNSTILYILVVTFLDLLLLLLFVLSSTLLFLLENVSCASIMPLQYVGLLFRLSAVSHSVWLCTLTFISIKRCRSTPCLLRHCCHHPQQLLKVMNALLGAFFITFIIVIAIIFSLCIVLLYEHCWVFYLFLHTFNLLLCAPFILISSKIVFTHFKPGSQQQQPKRLDIVMCLIVLFTLPLSLCNFLQEVGYIVLPSQVLFLLICIHRSINPIICFLVGRCWKPCSVGSLWLSLQRVFD